jgi:hypothetical protein
MDMAVEYLGAGSPDGTLLGRSTTDKVALYGVTPVTQRASSNQATSFLSLSTNVTVPANLTAIVLEIANTLIGLGAWKGAA